MTSYFLLLAAASSSGLLCPSLTEVYADPRVSDRLGEFLEIALPPQDSTADSLLVSVDGVLVYAQVPSCQIRETRLLLCPDSASQAYGHPFPCTPPLRSLALANSRSLQIIVSQGSCWDSSSIAPAVTGRSWRRAPGGELWTLSEQEFVPGEKGTPGWPDPDIEGQIFNLRPRIILPQSSHREGTPEALGSELYISLHTDGPGSEPWPLIVLPLNPPGDPETLFVAPNTWVQWDLFHHCGWYRAQIQLHGDDYPLDNVATVLAYFPGSPPARITELLPAPLDDSPEWFEVLNASLDTLPPHAIAPCGYSAYPQALAPGQFAVFTQDSTPWARDLPGTPPFWWQPPVWRTLKNSADTLRLCLWEQAVDSAWWGRSLPRALQGKAVQLDARSRGDVLSAGQTRRPSPGYQNTAAPEQRPCRSILWTRTPRISDPAGISLRLESGTDSARVELLNPAGNRLRHAQLGPGESRTFQWNPQNTPILEKGPLLLRTACGSQTHWQSLVILP